MLVTVFGIFPYVYILFSSKVPGWACWFAYLLPWQRPWAGRNQMEQLHFEELKMAKVLKKFPEVFGSHYRVYCLWNLFC